MYTNIHTNIHKYLDLSVFWVFQRGSSNVFPLILAVLNYDHFHRVN